MEIAKHVLDLAALCGVPSYYLEEKALELNELIDARLDTDLPFLFAHDIQGPQTDPRDSTFRMWPNVQSALLSAPVGSTFQHALATGWDRTITALYARRKLGMPQIPKVCELGSTFEINGSAMEVKRVDSRSMFPDMMLSIFEGAAEQNRQISLQGNITDRVSCLYAEAYGRERGNLERSFALEGRTRSTEELYQSLRDGGIGLYFEMKEGYIIFDPTPENAEKLSRHLRLFHPLHPLRFEYRGDKLGFFADLRDDPNFTLEDQKAFVESLNLAGVKLDHNPDFCTDIIYDGDGKDVSKEESLKYLGSEIFGANSDRFNLIMIGDKKGDIVEGKNSIFIPQTGSPVHKHCCDKGMDYVDFKSDVDANLGVAACLYGRGVVSDWPPAPTIKPYIPKAGY